MDIIRKEASILIKNVLEESVNIINNRQQIITEFESQNYNNSKKEKSLSECSETESMSHILNDDNGPSISENNYSSLMKQSDTISTDTTVLPPTSNNRKEQRVEKKFQKLSSQVENIDKSVESFDQTFDSIVHEDEISSLHQDFSKISWNDSISATTSTIADIEQSTPDTDIQDFLTDTGGENIQRDAISEEMPLEMNVLELDSTPRPTPRTCLASFEETSGKRPSEEPMEKEDPRKDFPIPQPRQQKNVTEPAVEFISKNLDQFDDDPRDSTQLIHETEEDSVERDILSEREDQSSVNDAEADDKLQRLGLHYDIDDHSLTDTENLPIEHFTPQNVESVGSMSQIKPFISNEFVPLQEVYDFSTSSKVSISPKPVHLDDAFPSDQIESTKEFLEDYHLTSLEPSINTSFKRSPSLSDSLTKLIDVDCFEDDKSEKSEEKDSNEPQLSFYIGESSTNIIVKSKSSQYDDELESAGDSLVKDGGDMKEEGNIEDTCTEESAQVESKSDSDNVPIVVRQGSETRNDILEIENELQKPISDENNVNAVEAKEPSSHIATVDKASAKESSLHDEALLDLTKESSEPHEIQLHGTEPQTQTKASKLDLLLEKSELELSEKRTLPSATKLTDTIETSKADTSLTDKLLVERTLEEVQMSLDAAKEELIQVVRDGKAIKESPSEFEFKNISHSKLHLMDEGDDKCESLVAPTVLDDIQETNDLLEDHEHDEGEKVEDGSKVESSAESAEQSVEKPLSPTNNRWSLHDLDNSSSSESYYKSASRPCSSDFDTVQTFHTSSDYQTAIDASMCRGSTEYVSALGTLESSGKTISSRESMKSLSSEASGNLGSIDASELSETLVASLGDQDIEIEIENEGFEALELDQIMHSHQVEFEAQQSCMKRSQEMIFTKEEITTEIPETDPKQLLPESNVGSFESKYDQIIASSLEESSILSMSSASTVNTVVNNFEDLIGSAGSSSLAGIEMFGSFNAEEPILQFDDVISEVAQSEIDPLDKPSSADEPRRRGHKRHESTSVSNEVVKNLLEEESESASPESTEPKTESSSGNLGGDDLKGSESESDHDPYESEYSRAFKSPSQRKKKKEKKPTDASEECQESVLGPMHLAAQTIIEDAVTEELESQIIAEEERRPSQNMQDYSKIPDIMVTEEISKYSEETDDFPDSTLYKVKTQDELNKVEDTPIPRTAESAYSMADEQFNVLVQQQYKQKLADLNEASDFDSRAPDSPDSFEMVDQPDITDEFVIIEEVAKEASEFDVEGKSIKISSSKMVKKHDEEVEQILIKSAPAATNLGSQIFRDDLNFEFEESPPSAQTQAEQESAEMAANKKWVEMQLSDHAAQLRYPYELERGVLEDIKEEDAEFEVGSSRISSFKDSSFSSTPDYDVLAGRKYFSKAENDNMSVSSLQEFESLEQAISLENRRIYHGSTDSSNGSFTRRYTIKNACGDDISLSSLKEFEGLENACIEAHLIEIKAKEEAALLLSRSDESNKSNNGSESTNNVVVSKLKTITLQSIPRESVEAILKSKLEECEDAKSNVMETSIDSLEMEGETSRNKFAYEASEHGSADSLEINKSVELVTSSIDSFDISKEITTKSDADSLEPISNRESVDSIEIEQKQPSSLIGSELESAPNTAVSVAVESNEGASASEVAQLSTSIISIPANSSRISMDMSNDSLNLCVEQTSSAATNATYCNEGDSSMMSDSLTSCASSTLIEDSVFPAANQSFALHSHTENIYFEDESLPANSKTVDDSGKKAETKP